MCFIIINVRKFLCCVSSIIMSQWVVYYTIHFGLPNKGKWFCMKEFCRMDLTIHNLLLCKARHKLAKPVT